LPLPGKWLSERPGVSDTINAHSSTAGWIQPILPYQIHNPRSDTRLTPLSINTKLEQ